ncbi:hypothetical protein ABE437_03360 [Isoptericola cucumis]|uniref:pentapeptide repeat-containing protein n=1 Tax=Isoptericola cucumis TaxID=1776856 RepID=UPI00320B0F73
MSTKRNSKLIPFLAATALVGGLAVVGTATAASADRHISGGDVKNGSLTGVDIRNSSLTGSDIKNSSLTGADVGNGTLGGADVKNDSLSGADIKSGSLGVSDLSSSARAALKGATGKTGPQGDTGPAGTDGKDGAPGQDGVDGKDASVEYQVAGENVVIANIGGSFATRATDVGSVDVAAGTYLVNTYGAFDRVDDAAGSSPVLQLAVRAADGSTWGQDLGTAFTGEYPATGDLEQTASAVRYITVESDTTVSVKAFGYNADKSSTGSGNYTVDADITLVKIG